MEWPPEIILGQGTDEIEKVNSAINESFTFIDQTIPFESYAAAGGCICENGCTLESCSCIRKNFLGQIINPATQRLIPLVHGLEFEGPFFQCGASCGCKGSCSNALSLQRTLRHSLILQNAPGKGGLGVFAINSIPVGAYICDYCGELLCKEEAVERLRKYDATGHGHALLVIREVLPSGTAALRSHVDATIKGNLARFFNHRRV